MTHERASTASNFVMRAVSDSLSRVADRDVAITASNRSIRPYAWTNRPSLRDAGSRLYVAPKLYCADSLAYRSISSRVFITNGPYCTTGLCNRTTLQGQTAHIHRRHFACEAASALTRSPVAPGRCDSPSCSCDPRKSVLRTSGAAQKKRPHDEGASRAPSDGDICIRLCGPYGWRGGGLATGEWL